MSDANQTAVIIAAAGSSNRMGGGLPKQYRMCEGLPVLVKSVKAFCAIKNISHISVVVRPDDVDYCKELLRSWGIEEALVCTGGETRQESVMRAFETIPPGCDYVLVHDAARPFVSEAVIEGVMEALKTNDAVIPCVAPKSTIRTEDETLDRSKLFEVQTPQGFRKSILGEAFNKAVSDGFTGTDEAGLVERLGKKVFISKGSYENIKITTAEDMPVTIRMGNGYDVHRLVSGRPLMLACTEIPYEKGLLGHSDADVISHAIADAILGAAALGDIGHHFPENDPSCEGMSGKALLGKTLDILRKAGYEIVNIDATLIAQRPKIAPYIESMRINTAAALEIPPSAVSIKATTEEGLGFTGDGSAMSCMATACIRG